MDPYLGTTIEMGITDIKSGRNLAFCCYSYVCDMLKKLILNSLLHLLQTCAIKHLGNVTAWAPFVYCMQSHLPSRLQAQSVCFCLHNSTFAVLLLV